MPRAKTLRTVKLAMALLAALVVTLLRPVAASAAPLDGGPGGGCLNDRDCGICGWVCSSLRGNVCVPAREGDPGQCAGNGGCACPGQTCMSGACTPAPNPVCGCNGDCPAGEVCDQLLFTCHQASPAFCGQPYDGYDFGPPSSGPACGCNGICGGGDGGARICEAQGTSLPSLCASDLDCGACYQGYSCLDGICTPAGTAGWCTDTRDLMPTFPVQTRIDAGAGGDAGPGFGSTTGTGAKSSGCAAGGDGGNLSALAVLGAVILLKRRRATLATL